jgi:hypothetical protein
MVQRVPELVWWRERDRLEQRSGEKETPARARSREAATKREGLIDRGGRWNRVARERECCQRERVDDERDGKVKVKK